MSHEQFPTNASLPAPCIVDNGILVSKQDIQRLLSDLGRVRYFYWQDDRLASDGEGFVLDVFQDPCRSTLVANNSLYLNVQSFDYLELSRPNGQVGSRFTLVQDSIRLELIPLSDPLQDQGDRAIDTAALEAVVAEVLSAGWDLQMDDEDNLLP